jgi:hypothetical protein
MTTKTVATPPTNEQSTRRNAAAALISREEAAEICGVSVDTFDRHVRAHVVTRRIGRRVLVDEQSVRSWAGRQRIGEPSAETEAPDSPTPGRSALSPGAQEILFRMERRRAKRSGGGMENRRTPMTGSRR